jgi:hypothetical protein
MDALRGSGTRNSALNAAGAGLRLLPALFLLAAALLLPQTLEACAMSALVAREGYNLDQIPRVGPAGQYWQYNDPWDYFAFVMANSSEYSNDDGYGIVAYDPSCPLLPDRRRWYKRVREGSDFGMLWYTGGYLQSDEIAQEWTYDVFDEAMFNILTGNEPSSIVLCHARNASGVTYGNHPFWFNFMGRTYTFMHNGNANASRSSMINRILQLNPYWFERHPNNYFEDHDPLHWVDTEVLFHYIMAHIAANNGNTLYGLKMALIGIRSELLQPLRGIYNFILSDGEKVYVFRNSPLTGYGASYRLSYCLRRDQFFGIRTQAPLPGDVELQPMELVVISRERYPTHYPDIAEEYPAPHVQQYPPTVPRKRPPDAVPVLLVSPNPFSGSTTLRVSLSEPLPVRSEIYNLKGEVVKRLIFEFNASGTVSVSWDGKDEQGRPLGNGIYLIRTTVGKDVFTDRISLIR